MYVAGVLFKRGASMQQAGYRMQIAGVTIRSIPLIAGRLTEHTDRQAFLSKAYLGQLGGGAGANDEGTSAVLGEELLSQLLKRM